MIKWKPSDVITRMQKALMPEAQPQNTAMLLEQLKEKARQVPKSSMRAPGIGRR